MQFTDGFMVPEIESTDHDARQLLVADAAPPFGLNDKLQTGPSKIQL